MATQHNLGPAAAARHAPVAVRTERVALLVARGLVVFGLLAGAAWGTAGSAAARPNVDPPPCVSADPSYTPSPLSFPPASSATTIGSVSSLRADMTGGDNCLVVGEAAPAVL